MLIPIVRDDLRICQSYRPVPTRHCPARSMCFGGRGPRATGIPGRVVESLRTAPARECSPAITSCFATRARGWPVRSRESSSTLGRRSEQMSTFTRDMFEAARSSTRGLNVGTVTDPGE